MSQALRKLTASISRSNCMVIFINQIRMKIGVMYGSPETTTGGNALKFYASVRLDIRRIGSIKDKEEVIGNTTRVKVVKNKVAPPFRQVEFDIMYGSGISKVGELVDLGSKAGIIEKSGSWFSYENQRIGQGRENAKAFLTENPDIAAKIEAAVRANAADVETDRRIELQRIAAGGRFRVAEHDADLHADLVDEEDDRVRAGDRTGQLAQGLAHQTGLQARERVAHFAFDFGLRRQGRDRVDDHDIDGAGANQRVGDFKGLFAGVRLGHEEFANVHAELLGVADVEGVFSVHEGRDAAELLDFSNDVERKGGLAG
jgi:hypothetical protein